MEKVLVTGSNGFVGSWIVKELSKDHIVFGCGTSPLPTHVCENYFKWDISCDEEPKELCNKNLNTIIHTAASKDYNNLSKDLVQTNCFGTYQILKTAVEHKCKCIIYMSGLPIIGTPKTVPINEQEIFEPQSLYHATKAAGEFIIEQASHYGIRVISLRIPSPIGPGMDLNTIVPVFIKRAIDNEDLIIQGKGTRKQNYLDVRDLAKAIGLLINNEKAKGVYNIGASNIISNIELANRCVRILESNSQIAFSGRPDLNDNVDWTTDDSKLRALIGNYQFYDLEKSIRDIARWMKKDENCIF